MVVLEGARQSQRPSALSEPDDRNQSNVNVGDTERWLSLLGGATLGAYGLSQGGLSGLLLAGLGGALIYRGVSGHCSCYQALGINTAEKHGPATVIPAGHGVKVEERILINKPAAELYRFWRNLENLGRFLQHIESIRSENHHSHWIARGPLGMRFEWDAEIINDRPNEMIAWRSLPGSSVDTAGSVHFKQVANKQGTEIQVNLKYDPPAGKAGDAIARLFGGSPPQEIRDDLRRLKEHLESAAGPSATAPHFASGDRR
jgi:uncharacterized membrane protein